MYHEDLLTNTVFSWKIEKLK